MQRLRQFKPGEKMYFVKVDQRGQTLYVHPCYDPHDDREYEVRDYKDGAAMWKDEAAAILFIKEIERCNPGVKFKLEMIVGKK